MMSLSLPRWSAVCLLLVLGITAFWADAAEPLSAAEKRALYEQMKLPELVRKANANDSSAQFELGSRFNYGREAPKNNVEALRWLRRAAQGGHREAQRLLAVKLYNGYDIPPDHEGALLWAQHLAEAGDVPGQMMAGNMYANGEGTPRDLVRAYMWYDVAATGAQQANGDPLQQQAAMDARDRTAALLLPGEEMKAQELATGWWQRQQGVSLTPQAKPQAKARAKKPAAKKKAAESKSAAPKAESKGAEKSKAPQKPKLPGSSEATVKPKATTP
jgi:TPR repeat protein